MPCMSGSILARTKMWLLSVTLALAVPLSGQAAYSIAPPAGWVERVSVPIEELSSDTITSDTELLLVDVQDRVRDSQLETFVHTAYQLLDASDVQSGSQIEVVFDSSYQNLILHSVKVIRNGTVIDQLQQDRIHVMRRETQLEFQIYDGSLSVVILPEDVRRGDVVEYSYTREGSNPVFAGHYARTLTTQATVPLHRLHFRLVWQSARPLFVHPSADAPEPDVNDMGSYKEYVLDRTGIPPLPVDANLPSWYDPFPWIQFSDFATWSDVAAWGHSLFTVPEQVPAELDSIVSAIRSAQESSDDHILAALRFVQDEVRYLGIEIGVNSHAPQPPEIVMRRRFGDCKDKSLLLMTVLQQLGVEASPALVSSQYLEHVGAFHPTTDVFDHVIVQARPYDQVHWLDPSSLYERGSLEDMTPPYGAALVLDPAVDSLSRIIVPELSDPLIDVSARFELGAVGQPAQMQVRTLYSGTVANGTRGVLQTSSMEQLERQYRDYYSQIYPSVESSAPLEIEDIESNNIIRTVETYTIPEFWEYSEEHGANVGSFYPLEVDDRVPGLTPANRTMPYYVPHPVYMRHKTEVSIAEGWAIEPKHVVIETPAVYFEFDVETRGNLLTLTYEYETLKDHVLAEDFLSHIDEMSRIRDLLGYTVTAPAASDAVAPWRNPHELNWPILLTALFMTGLAIIASLRVYRLQPSIWPQQPMPSGESPCGLDGWLVLVGIGVTLGPLVLLASFVSTLPAYSATFWSSVTTPASDQYHALWAPLLIFELCANIAQLVFGVLLIVTFYRRMRLFPALFVVYTAALVAVTVIDAAASRGIPALVANGEPGWGAAPASFVPALIWIAYMFRSRRVRNTFVN